MTTAADCLTTGGWGLRGVTVQYILGLVNRDCMISLVGK